ncbi:protein of unknown function [Paraburkholderia dioscoreae]|uniref:Uncharacterized protein n=1 Tax=Paraburkholderia dioscoreae TaxID=2604047 RepID=A0A5Q4YWY6_9BURK|nr:protein of unknown function [Paraburkholderia dioscoreae]
MLPAVPGKQIRRAIKCLRSSSVHNDPVVLTDNTDPFNRSNVLTPAADSTAKGIGLQILNNKGALVSFGSDSSEPFTTNQWLIGASPDGRLQVPLTVQ